MPARVPGRQQFPEIDAEASLGRRVDVVTAASLPPALRECVLAQAVPL